MTDVPHEQLEAALSRFLDGEAEPEDEALLADGLASGQLTAAEVTGLLAVDDWLRQQAEPDEESFVSAVDTGLAAEDDSDAFVHALQQRLNPSAAFPLVPWIVAVAATLVAAASITLHFAQPDAASQKNPPAAKTPAAAETPAPPPVMALLVNEAGACFADEAAPDSVRLTAGEYRLEAGAVHLRLVNGVDVVFRAPMRFTLRDPSRLDLHEGSLRAVVPESAHGFTVMAPDATFEDRGTEFGVSVAGGASELHVFEGRVDVQTPAMQAEKVSVNLGESVQIRDGSVMPGNPPDPEKFLTPDHIGYLRWLTWRDRLKHDPDLVCYFPFSRDADHPAQLQDHAEHGEGITGTISGARWVSGRWLGKAALLFDRDGDEVAIHIPGQYDAFTVATWVKIDRLDFELNAVLDSDSWERGDVHWQISRRGNIRCSCYDPTQASAGTGEAVPVGEWVHLAAVYDRQTSRMVSYVNGQATTTLTLVPDALISPGGCRLGNWLRRPDWPHAPNRGFRGRMDEFILWRRALTPDEISDLVEEGRPTALWAVDRNPESPQTD